MSELHRAADLLAALAEGQALPAAAASLDLDPAQARDILLDLAGRLEGQAKEWDKIQEEAAAAGERDAPVAAHSDELVFAFDGGSRGNPGPSAGAAVALDKNGKPLAERVLFFERATNNFAEYQGLLLAIGLARDLGVRHLALQGDSELIVNQLRGVYKVKNKQLMPLFIQAQRLLRDFDNWKIRHVLREQNNEADALVNETLNEKTGKRKKARP